MAPILAWGWAGYEWYQVFREWESVEQGRADARKLLEQSRQGVHRLWQNEIITDEEYFLYLATGTLVVQPDQPRRPPGEGRVSSASQEATDQRWWAILWQGYAYNRARMFDFPFNEVYVEGPNGVRYRVDAFDPGKEIVSRKNTQFALISVDTGIKYVREMVEKYKPGTKIAPVDSSKGVLKVTKVLSGRMILSVPVQRHPIPRKVLEEAKKKKVTIRDDFGNEFELDKPLPNHPKPPPAYQKGLQLDAEGNPIPGAKPSEVNEPKQGESEPKYIELEIPDTP